MLRRSLCKSFLRVSPALRNLTGSYTAADRENELKAEAELRARVTKGMSMNFPTYDHTVYASYETSPGVFNSGGAGLSGGGSGGNGSSASPSGHRQTPSMPQMPFPFGFMNKLTGAAAGGGGGGGAGSSGSSGQQQQPRNTFTDWVTFITGIILLGYSLKILLRGSGAEAGGDGVVIPMWVGTPMLKAHYIVFSAVTSPAERDALKAEFGNFQRTMPQVSFFDWLNQKYPGWAAGHRYPQSHVMSIVAAAVGPGSDATKIPRLMAGVLQRSSGVGLFGASSAISNNTVDRRKLIDDMVDTITPAVANIAGAGAVGSLFGGLNLPGVVPPQAPPVGAAWGGAAGPAAGYAYPPYPYQPPGQYGNGATPTAYPGQYGAPYAATYQQPQQQQYYQQQQQQHPQQQHTELRGTQEVSLSDIIGGAAPVPQHAYTPTNTTNAGSPPATNGNESTSSASLEAHKQPSSAGTLATSSSLSTAVDEVRKNEDPLKRTQ